MTAILRLMNDSDLDMILDWRNTESVRKNMYTHHLISKKEHRDWWKAQNVNPATRILICEVESEPLGVVSFTKYTGEGGTATWAFYSGNVSRRGIGRLMELAALDYAFEQLRVRRLECEVLSFNQSVIDFHRKHGFALEGIAKHAYDRDGELYNIYSLAMLSDDWFRRIKSTVTDADFRNNNLAGFKASFTVEVTPDLVDGYSAATNDNNPVHLNDEAARCQGFNGRIAHGMLLGGFFSRCFANEFPGPGTIYVSQTLDFMTPVPVDSVVTVNFRVVAHIGRRITVETIAKIGKKSCIVGEAILMLPKGYNVASVKDGK